MAVMATCFSFTACFVYCYAFFSDIADCSKRAVICRKTDADYDLTAWFLRLIPPITHLYTSTHDCNISIGEYGCPAKREPVRKNERPIMLHLI